MSTLRPENPDAQYSPAVLVRTAVLTRGGISSGQSNQGAQGLVKNEYQQPLKIEEVHFRVRQLPVMGASESRDTILNSLWPSSLRWYLHLLDTKMRLNDKLITASWVPVISFCPRCDETESHVFDEVAIWRPEPFTLDQNDDLYCDLRWAPDAVPFNPDTLNVLLPTQLVVEVAFFGKALPSGLPLNGSRRLPYVAAYREPVRPLDDVNHTTPIESQTPVASLQNGEEEPMMVQSLLGARVTAYSPWDPGANDFIRIYDSNGSLITRDDVPLLELFGVRRSWDCSTILKPKEYMTVEWNLGRQTAADDAPQVNDFGQIPGSRTFETTTIFGSPYTLLSRYQHIFGLVGYRETGLLKPKFLPDTSRPVTPDSTAMVPFARRVRR